MADISNKFLVFLLVIAILVTVVGTWYSIDRVSRLASLTGYGTAGYVNVTIGGRTEINVTQPYCGFGSGYVTEGYEFAVLHPGDKGIGDTAPYCQEPVDTKDNWTNTTAYAPNCIALENVGNTYAKINVSAGKDAASFIGGSSPEYKVWSENKDGLACIGTLVTFANRASMSTSNVTLCTNLSKAVGHTNMYAGCYLKIPKDAVANAKTDTWTFTATSAGS